MIKGRAGSTGLGIGAYLRDRVDALRGADDDRSRVERMKKLEAKIKEVSNMHLYIRGHIFDSIASFKRQSRRPTRLQTLSAKRLSRSKLSSNGRRSRR